MSNDIERAIDGRDNSGKTPLRQALIMGDLKAARIQAHVDVNALDESGSTPSQYATKQKIVELPSEYGAESVK